jgi:hypothetical protein
VLTRNRLRVQVQLCGVMITEEKREEELHLYPKLLLHDELKSVVPKLIY